MTQATRQRARKQPAAVRREEILETALHVFSRMPYRSAGTAEIAREAGVAEPTIYRHFSSKRELYLAALERTASQICDAWRRIIAVGDDSATTLAGIGDWYVVHTLTDADWLRLRHRAAAETDDPEVRRALSDGYDQIVEMIAGVIRRGQDQGEFSREVDALAAAWMFAGIGQVLDLAVLMGQNLEETMWCHKMSDVFKRCLIT